MLVIAAIWFCAHSAPTAALSANIPYGPGNWLSDMPKAKAKKSVGRIKQPVLAAVLDSAPLLPPRRRGRPRKIQPAQSPHPPASLMDAQKSVGSIQSQAGLDLTEKVKELLRLAREQGHLTY